MLEVLKFVFTDGWTFFGTCFLIFMVGAVLAWTGTCWRG